MGVGAISRMYHIETVPFTVRAHRVYRFHQAFRVDSECYFIGFKKEHASLILPANHERSIRVNQVLSKIVGAIYPRLASWTKEPLDWASELDWEAIVLQDDGIRARCCGGAGKIIVHTGLLDRFDTDEEIATVLAHEVGHVIVRHSLEMIVMFADWNWFPSILLMPFFRRCELEADFIGMILLAASGFFEKFEKIGRKNLSESILQFFALSTHPSPKERSRFLLRPKVIKKVMELYTRVTSVGQGSNKAEFHDLKL